MSGLPDVHSVQESRDLNINTRRQEYGEDWLISNVNVKVGIMSTSMVLESS